MEENHETARPKMVVKPEITAQQELDEKIAKAERRIEKARRAKKRAKKKLVKAQKRLARHCVDSIGDHPSHTILNRLVRKVAKAHTRVGRRAERLHRELLE